jgi:aminopeptidase N
MRRPIVSLLLVLLVACSQPAAQPSVVPEPAAPPTIAPVARQPDQPTVQPTVRPSAVPEPSRTPPSPAPIAAQRALSADQAHALKPAAEAEADLPNLPYYTMRISADPAAGTFSGSQVITYTNTSGAALPDIMLRSYVNFPPDIMGDGGDTEMNVTGATLAGQPLAVHREAQRTAFRITLPAALQPQAQITLETTFEGTLKPWDDGTWPFLSSYPLLAQWDSADHDWRSDVTRFPDRVFAQAALYDVTVTLPRPLQVFATGSPIISSDDGTTTSTRFISGPVREWAASFGEFDAVSTVTNGITVTAYQVQGDNLDIERVRDVAARSLESYESRFGPYPYRELDLHALEWDGDAGIEFPGFTLILIDSRVSQRTDFVVAHEVAHEWWYAVVGNDIYREPWLDESFANYSAVIATADRAGPELAQTIYDSEIKQAYERNLNAGDPPAGLAITDYASFNSYYRAIYGKGAVFLATLREEIGDEAFFAGMRAYYSAERHQIATRAAFETAMEDAAGRSLDSLFDDWLGAQ